MKIWHQSFTDLTALPRYRATLEAHANAVAAPGMEIVVHGLRPGTYGTGLPPTEINRNRYLKSLNEQQICQAAMAAEQAGYDAFALGCFFDPAVQAARSLVDIPVATLCESTLLAACSLGRRCALISINAFQRDLTNDLAAAYGLSSRLAANVPMTPPVSLFDLERDAAQTAPIRAGFERACQVALEAGAEVIIPGDGALNEFLFRHRLLQFDGATVMDALGVLFHHAAFMATARKHAGLSISRREHYAKATDAMLAHSLDFNRLSRLRESDFSGGPR